MNPAFASPRNYKHQVFCKEEAARFVAERNHMRLVVGRVFLQSAPHSLERTEFQACASFASVERACRELLGQDYSPAIVHEAVVKGRSILADSFMSVATLED